MAMKCMKCPNLICVNDAPYYQLGQCDQCLTRCNFCGEYMSKNLVRDCETCGEKICSYCKYNTHSHIVCHICGKNANVKCSVCRKYICTNDMNLSICKNCTKIKCQYRGCVNHVHDENMRCMFHKSLISDGPKYVTSNCIACKKQMTIAERLYYRNYCDECPFNSKIYDQSLHYDVINRLVNAAISGDIIQILICLRLVNIPRPIVLIILREIYRSQFAKRITVTFESNHVLFYRHTSIAISETMKISRVMDAVIEEFRGQTVKAVKLFWNDMEMFSDDNVGDYNITDHGVINIYSTEKKN